MPTHDFKDIGDVLAFDVLKGTIASIDSANDTCMVSVGGTILDALLFYHCKPDSVMRDNGAIEGAAAGFSVGDEVIVLKRHDNSVVKVIGHTDGIRRCEEEEIGGEYYIFYNQAGILNIAQCNYEEGLETIETRSYSEAHVSNTTERIYLHFKKFMHNVDGVTRPLYFMATSLYINTRPIKGWVNFCRDNPTFPLVANNADSKITMTPQVLADLNAVNYTVNHEHEYSGDSGGDYWKVLGPFEAGDCIANYEEIYTKEGIKKVGDLKVGDIVLSYDLETKKYVYKPIIKIWEKGLLPGVRVGLKNGQTIDITHKHPMWVRTNQGQSHGRKEISRYEKRYFKDIDLTRWWKRRLPIARKLPYKTKDIDWLTEDICFVIGHYLAEGWAEGHHVCSSGYDMPEHIFPILKKHDIPYSEYKNNSGVPCIRFLKSKFKTFLEGLKDNSFDIHLPEKMFHLPGNKLRAILDGFWLGDGHSSNYQKAGHTSNKQKVYSTSSKQWAEDIQRIGLQLGTSFHVWKQEHHQGLGNKPIYRISYNTNSHYYKDHGYEGLSEIGIARKHIEEIGMVEMRDFEVADTHTFIFKNGLVCHQCEDFALTKAQELLNMGYPASAIHIEVGENDYGSDHAWLVVQTTAGNYALDTSSDNAMINSALRTNLGTEYKGRMRQIGANWAAISPYAWMRTAQNDATRWYESDELERYGRHTWYYILDPLLNIIYPMFTTEEEYQHALFIQTLELRTSANFSTENIYIMDTKLWSDAPTVKTYKLNENRLDLINTYVPPYETLAILVVDRDGNVNLDSMGESTVDIISKQGYYDYSVVSFWLGDGSDRRYKPNAMIGREFDNSVYEIQTETSRIMYSPYGESFDGGDDPYFEIPWLWIDTDDLLIQSLVLKRAGAVVRRMYKNGASVLSEICAHFGIYEDNLLGLVYIPSTDRLNK